MIEDSETAPENLKDVGENRIYRVDTAFLPLTEEELYIPKTFFFYDYDTALNYVRPYTANIRILHSFSITRYRVFTGDEPPQTRNWGESAHFNSSGELLRIYGGKEQAFDKLCDCCAFVNPFNDMDIVMHYRGGEIGLGKR